MLLVDVTLGHNLMKSYATTSDFQTVNITIHYSDYIIADYKYSIYSGKLTCLSEIIHPLEWQVKNDTTGSLITSCPLTGYSVQRAAGMLHHSSVIHKNNKVLAADTSETIIGNSPAHSAANDSAAAGVNYNSDAQTYQGSQNNQDSAISYIICYLESSANDSGSGPYSQSVSNLKDY